MPARAHICRHKDPARCRSRFLRAWRGGRAEDLSWLSESEFELVDELRCHGAMTTAQLVKKLGRSREHVSRTLTGLSVERCAFGVVAREATVGTDGRGRHRWGFHDATWRYAGIPPRHPEQEQMVLRVIGLRHHCGEVALARGEDGRVLFGWCARGESGGGCGRLFWPDRRHESDGAASVVAAEQFDLDQYLWRRRVECAVTAAIGLIVMVTLWVETESVDAFEGEETQAQ